MSETKAMSQESEVTKWTDEQREAAGAVWWCPKDDETGKYGRVCAEIARVAHLFASAPPADARLREAVIEECAKVCIARAMRHKTEAVRYKREERPWVANDAQLMAGEDEVCAREIQALRSSPAPLSPSKGARETPALDEAIVHLRNLVADSVNPSDFQAYVNRAEAELSALKSAAPERPAMAVEAREVLEAVASALDGALGDSDLEHIEDDDELREVAPVQWACTQINTLLMKLTPAAASPTVKMPEREALGLALLKASGLWHGISADRVAKEFARPGATRNGALAQADAALAEFQRLNPPASPQETK